MICFFWCIPETIRSARDVFNFVYCVKRQDYSRNEKSGDRIFLRVDPVLSNLYFSIVSAMLQIPADVLRICGGINKKIWTW